MRNSEIPEPFRALVKEVVRPHHGARVHEDPMTHDPTDAALGANEEAK